jgi:hypothetical protein
MYVRTFFIRSVDYNYSIQLRLRYGIVHYVLRKYHIKTKILQMNLALLSQTVA